MKFFTTILIIFTTINLNAQNYDLLVTSQEDSIACNIDSVSNSVIYFKMKINNSWIKTNTPLSQIIEYKHNIIDKKNVVFESGTSYIKSFKEVKDFSDKSIYATRYMFSPSGFRIKQGENIYTNYDIFLQDFRTAISKSFSLGFGTTIFAMPFYVMPTYHYQINEKSAFAIGDLIMFVPYNDFTFFGNLLYGIYTNGNINNNFSLGIGLWTTTDSDIASKTISPAINISASLRINEKIQFLTENYYVQMNAETDFHYRPGEIVEEFKDETYRQYINIIGGISGLRFYTKSVRNSWQLGLVYYVTIWDFPNKYSEPGWYNFTNEVGFIAIPILSYSRIF